jgi:hypothetical protein
MGHTPNIAVLCTYSFYDYCWFWDSEQGFSDQQRVLGQWLGVSHDIGGPLTYFILPKSCRPIARSSVTPVNPEELLEPATKVLAEELDKAINEKIGKFRTDKEVDEELGMLFESSGDLYDGDLDPFDEIEAAEEAALMPEADDWTPETFDKYFVAEVLLPHVGELVRAKVTGRKRAADGTPVGVAHSNPILDTREYEVCVCNLHQETRRMPTRISTLGRGDAPPALRRYTLTVLSYTATRSHQYRRLVEPDSLSSPWQSSRMGLLNRNEAGHRDCAFNGG